MKALTETKDQPEIHIEFLVPRFLWGLVTGWCQLKGKEDKLPRYYDRQPEAMRAWDVENPANLPPPGVLVGKRPQFPMRALPRMIASKPPIPPPAKPTPSPPTQKNPAVDQPLPVSSPPPAPVRQPKTKPTPARATSPPTKSPSPIPSRIPSRTQKNPAENRPQFGRATSPPTKKSRPAAADKPRPAHTEGRQPTPHSPKLRPAVPGTFYHPPPKPRAVVTGPFFRQPTPPPTKQAPAAGEKQRPSSPREQKRVPAPATGHDSESDEDAYGSDEDSEPVTQPAQAPALAPAFQRKPPPATAPKTKPPPATTPKKTISDEEWGDTTEEERKERRRVKGKGKEIDPVKGEAGGETRKVRPEVKSTGEPRKPKCVRCVKGGRTCMKQAGGLVACVYCAKVKMKCEPADSDETPPAAPKRPAREITPGPSSVPAKRPATPTQEPKKRKKAPAPAPALSGTKAPAPATSRTKKKQIKSRETVASDEEHELAAWPGGKRNFEEFDAYYGMF